MIATAFAVLLGLVGGWFARKAFWPKLQPLIAARWPGIAVKL